MTQPARPVYPAPPRSGPPKSSEAVKQVKTRKVLPPTLTASHRSALDRLHVGACIDSGKKHVGSICLWRSPKQRDFSDSDTLFLERTSNDFAALLRVKRPRQRSSNKRKAVPILNPPPSPGIFVLGNQNEVVFMNEEARALLSLIDKSGSPEEASEQPFLLRLRRIREEIVQRPFRSASERLKTGNGSTSLDHLFAFRGISFSCRGTLLDGGPPHSNLVLVLVETERGQGNVLSPFDLSSAREKSQRGEFGLTDQEEAVARLISRGLTNKEAASELGISVYTIKGHVKRIMKKLGVNTRAAITTKIMTQ